MSDLPENLLPQPLRAVFVDLDGVLADFHHEVARLYGLDPTRLDDNEWAHIGEWALSIEKPDFWPRIQAGGAQWWADLPELPWAKQLWDACNAACDCVVVLTTPGPFPESAAGKYSWVREHLDTTRMLIGSPKHVCSKPGHVLVDDRSSYRRRWEAEGGRMVPLARPWNRSALDPEDIVAAFEALA